LQLCGILVALSLDDRRPCASQFTAIAAHNPDDRIVPVVLIAEERVIPQSRYRTVAPAETAIQRRDLNAVAMNDVKPGQS
jgi:hypothetical protein